MAFAIVLITRLTLFPLRSNLSVLQVSLYATAAAPLSHVVYNALAHSVTQVYRLPATWRPERYQDWTSTSKQTMALQDTRAGDRRHLQPIL
jgi:hypothetical protein